MSIIPLKTVFGGADPAGIKLISKENKNFNFYYVLLTFIVNVFGLIH